MLDRSGLVHNTAPDVPPLPPPPALPLPYGGRAAALRKNSEKKRASPSPRRLFLHLHFFPPLHMEAAKLQSQTELNNVQHITYNDPEAYAQVAREAMGEGYKPEYTVFRVTDYTHGIARQTIHTLVLR